MANATITGTASNFGSISGVLAGEAGTVAGTITGTVSGTLTGSVGVPGAGVPSGGTTGQVLKKVSNTDYDTTWGTDLASAAWGTITGTLSSQTDLQTALNLKADLASPALTGNPTAPTAATGDNDTTIATTAFVQQELAAGTAIAKSLEVYVRNQTGATLTAGTIVYINGATGNRPTVTKAQANNDANSAQTFGFVKTSIANNGFGYVIVRGEVENIDTSALTEGQQLYLSPTTAGSWTTTKPSAPQHLVYVGIVIRSHPTQGIILVAIQNGYELDEIHDVKITSPSNGQVLKYDSAQGLWVNGTDSTGVAWGAITGTLSSQTDLQSALNLKLNSVSPAATGDLTITGSFTTLTASSALFKYTHSTNIEYCELTRDSFTLFADTSDKSVEITNAGIRLYDPAAAAAATITFPDNSVQSIAFPGFAGYATESYVTTALGSYLTTSAASSTYAPLASPALTGTPTAPTASAGTNTTQIATTAFVQQEVPAASTTAAGKVELATETENILGTDTSRVLSVNDRKVSSIDCGLWAPGVVNLSSAVSGTGANAGSTVTTLQGRLVSPNASTVGYATRGFPIGYISNSGTNRYNFGTKSGHAVKVMTGTWGTTTIVAMKIRAVFGRQALALPAPGTLAALGYGWEWDMAARQLSIIAHNGTTLTTKGVTWNPTSSRSYEFTVTSDGSGTVSLYVDGAFLDSTTGGPTGYATASMVWWQVEIENTSASATGAQDLFYQNPKLYTTNG